VELDSKNELGRYFGLDATATNLLRADVHQLRALRQSSRFRHGAACLPFGVGSEDEKRAAVEMPDWLDSRLCALEAEVAILDLPAGKPEALRGAIEVADRLIGVLVPDENAFSTMLATEGLLSAAGFQGRAEYLVNQYDARQVLHREVVAALRGTLNERIAPHVVQWDGQVSELGNRRQLLLQESPESQVGADLSEIAGWLLPRSKMKG
jgi:MinD-like ATPase involved in chromosome partitioning or flagellar assembly